MNKLLFLALLFSVSIFTISCDDETDNPIDYEYHAHVHAPTSVDKHVGDTLFFDINFESHSGEPVHHINVVVYNKADNTEIYNKPAVAHVHAESGEYLYEDFFMLTEANGVNAHTDWIVEAKVWGETAGEGEEVETVEFHVHP